MDENEIRDVKDHLEPQARFAEATDREGIAWGVVFLLVWAILLIVFSVQNAHDATVDFLVWSWSMPVALLTLITALVTLVITWIGSAFYRRRRRQSRELKRAFRSKE
jgi:uncharacterized integral membrane protein